MPDRYPSFAVLSAHEDEGTDFQVRLRLVDSPLAIIAPHGGGIESGSSEIADAVAGGDYSFYAFEGIKRSENSSLHLTSTHFDEPRCLRVLSQSEVVIAIHGRDLDERTVFLGGTHTELVERLAASLREAGFGVALRDDPAYQGRSPDNICNRGRSGRGVQIEVARGVRKTLFAALSAQGRKVRTWQFLKFTKALRKGLKDEIAARSNS